MKSAPQVRGLLLFLLIPSFLLGGCIRIRVRQAEGTELKSLPAKSETMRPEESRLPPASIRANRSHVLFSEKDLPAPNSTPSITTPTVSSLEVTRNSVPQAANPNQARKFRSQQVRSRPGYVPANRTLAKRSDTKAAVPLAASARPSSDPALHELSVPAPTEAPSSLRMKGTCLNDQSRQRLLSQVDSKLRRISTPLSKSQEQTYTLASALAVDARQAFERNDCEAGVSLASKASVLASNLPARHGM
jgi:hypothetical protein